MTPPKKQPTIRPGQRKPYVKATHQQIDSGSSGGALTGTAGYLV
jgi:hypothetical protein